MQSDLSQPKRQSEQQHDLQLHPVCALVSDCLSICLTSDNTMGYCLAWRNLLDVL